MTAGQHDGWQGSRGGSRDNLRHTGQEGQSSLGDTLADRLGLIEVDTLGDTRADVGAEVLVNTLPERLGQVEFETVIDTLAKVEAEEVVNTLGDRLSSEGRQI